MEGDGRGRSKRGRGEGQRVSGRVDGKGRNGAGGEGCLTIACMPHL